jgi:hypothetical protein
MEGWGNFGFWFIYLNQIIAFFAVVFIVNLAHPRRSFALMAAINFAPAVSLIFAAKSANLYVGLLMLVSCIFTFWLIFGVVFSRSDDDYRTGIKVLTISPVFNSAAAFFLTGANKFFNWRICLAMVIVSCLFSLLSFGGYRYKRYEK